MTNTIQQNNDWVTFTKDLPEEQWFGNGNCSYENVQKFLKTDKEIYNHQFYDDKYIGSKVIYYFKR